MHEKEFIYDGADIDFSKNIHEFNRSFKALINKCKGGEVSDKLYLICLVRFQAIKGSGGETWQNTNFNLMKVKSTFLLEAKRFVVFSPVNNPHNADDVESNYREDFKRVYKEVEEDHEKFVNIQIPEVRTYSAAKFPKSEYIPPKKPPKATNQAESGSSCCEECCPCCSSCTLL